MGKTSVIHQEPFLFVRAGAHAILSEDPKRSPEAAIVISPANKETENLMTDRISRHGYRYIAQHFGLLIPFGVCLFFSAGTWNWPRGWATLGSLVLSNVFLIAILALRAPETLNQRGADHGKIMTFDLVFSFFWQTLSWALAIVAGLDCVRFGGSSATWTSFAAGAGMLCVATGLGTWAMLENEHFEQYVRIQHDRNHRVVDTGPYRFVRHPGYLAAITSTLSAPWLLGSTWSLVPAVLIAILFAWRTTREDKTLREQLDGYVVYTQKTRYRLIPYIW